MSIVYVFLEIKRVEVNTQQKYMVGGWQWKDNKIRDLMMKEHPIRSFLKFLLPFKSLRKAIRSYIQTRNSLRTPEMSTDDREMLKVFYKEDIKKLSFLLERDLNYWAE